MYVLTKAVLNFADDGFEGITPEEWSKMLDKVELSDPSQLEVAAVVSGKMASKDTSSDDESHMENNSTMKENNDTLLELEHFTRTPQEQKSYDDTILAMETSLKLLTFDGMKYIERAKSLSKRYVSKWRRF